MFYFSHVLRNNSNSQNVGAFAQCNLVQDPGFPELAFLQKSILHPSRSCLRQENEETNDNVKGDLNSNVSPDVKLERKDIIKDTERLSCSDVSDGSDFVLVDLVSYKFSVIVPLQFYYVFFPYLLSKNMTKCLNELYGKEKLIEKV